MLAATLARRPLRCCLASQLCPFGTTSASALRIPTRHIHSPLSYSTLYSPRTLTTKLPAPITRTPSLIRSASVLSHPSQPQDAASSVTPLPTSSPMTETHGNFDLLQRVKVDYADVTLSKWRSRQTGLTVVHVDYECQSYRTPHPG